MLAKVLDSSSRTLVGGAGNDELLGHHGSDTLVGNAGKDVLWGDWDPDNNNSSQRDVIRGGAGNDFIYPSHGRSTIDAGPGNDTIRAFYGRGTIDCGAGDEGPRPDPRERRVQDPQLRAHPPLLPVRLQAERRLQEAGRDPRGAGRAALRRT